MDINYIKNLSNIIYHTENLSLYSNFYVFGLWSIIKNLLLGFINLFLSWKAWIPLSRLTYGVYLLHIFVIEFFYLTREKSLHYQDNLFVSKFELYYFLLFRFPRFE